MLILEAVSFAAFLLPWLVWPVFILLSVCVAALTVRRLEYGLLALFMELFIGSKGYLFFVSIGDISISLRHVMWLAVMTVWLVRFAIALYRHKISFEEIKKYCRNNLIFCSLLVLGVFIIWGTVNGFLHSNGIANIYPDANGWLFFALMLPLFTLPLVSGPDGNSRLFEWLMPAFIVAVLWLAVKTIFLLFLFSHVDPELLYPLYRWIRVSGVGEITNMKGGFYRVFFQSHIYSLIGFFVFYLLTMYFEEKKERQKAFFTAILSILAMSTLVISFSRSNWIGLAAGMGVYALYLLFTNRAGWRKTGKAFGSFAAISIASVLLVALVVKFPFPRPTGGFNTANLLQDRATNIAGEAGASSRWALLPELMARIKTSPFFGLGFGATVTYHTSDPRILESDPSGEYTTYAFEWGWLDIWLKLGLFGVIWYISYVIWLLRLGFKAAGKTASITGQIILASVLGLAAIASTSIFSPYMNHPLGIGWLLLTGACLAGKDAKIINEHLNMDNAGVIRHR